MAMAYGYGSVDRRSKGDGNKKGGYANCGRGIEAKRHTAKTSK